MNYEKYLTREISQWILSQGNTLSDITLISGKKLFATKNGEIVSSNITISQNDMRNIIDKMCCGSVYANQSTLKHGYVTLEDGDRVGFVGTAVSGSDGKIESMRAVTALNIRISREVIGASKDVIGYVTDGRKIYNTLIISPPSRGKTTILRDALRVCGNNFRCGVVDERGEISGKENDLGRYSVVLKGCKKGEGINLLLRTMAPSAIFTDEIGSEEDERAIQKSINAGVKIVCTAHGYDEKDVCRRRALKTLLDEKVFERVIVLESEGAIGSVKKVIGG